MIRIDDTENIVCQTIICQVSPSSIHHDKLYLSIWDQDFSLGWLFLWKSRKISQSKPEIQKSAMDSAITETYAHSVFIL